MVVHNILDDIVDRVVDTLHHARKNKARLHHVLIRIHTDHEMRRAAVLFTLLLDSVESAETGVAGSGEDHVSAFPDLREREFFALAGIVPRAVGDAHVVFDDADLRVNGLRAFLVPFRETMNQTDVHAAEKTDGAGLRGLRGEYADEIGTFVF